MNTRRRKVEDRAQEDGEPATGGGQAPSPSLASRTFCVLDSAVHGAWHRAGHKFTHNKGSRGPRMLQRAGLQLSEALALGSPGQGHNSRAKYGIVQCGLVTCVFSEPARLGCLPMQTLC